MIRRPVVRAVGVSVVVVALSGVLVSGAAATPSGPGPGNSANAKLCHKGGWQSLYTSSGGTFSSEEQCTSYAAQGGTLTTTPPPPPESQAQIDCEAAGGTYSTDPASNSLGLGGAGTVVFTCNGASSSDDNFLDDCLAAGGNAMTDNYFGGDYLPPYDNTCYHT